MSQNGGDFDGQTAYSEPHAANNQLKGKSFVKPPINPYTSISAGLKPSDANASSLPFVDDANYFAIKRPLCIPIGAGGVKAALLALDAELKESGAGPLISDKRPHSIVGRQVNPGSFGLYEYASQPVLILEPGKYPGLPLSNWIGCDWIGTFNLTANFPPLTEGDKGLLVPSEKYAKLGLTIVQTSQNQAAVCLDPQNRVFVVTDGGFVAMATSGAYRIIALVDRVHLSTAIKDPNNNQVLGHMQQVKISGGYVAATFLDIPANNVAILQRQNELFELGAGQHHIVNPSITLRGLFTKGEVQQEMTAENIYTRDQVPVWLRMYLRYELQRPMELTRHGYKTPFDSLQDKTRSILTQILAHLDYSAMARARNVSVDVMEGNHPDDHEDVSTVFVSAVRTQATDELKVVAAEYGIMLSDLAIIDRRFTGEIAMKMDSLTSRALEAQVESANLDRENANRRRKQEGDQRVLELQNAMKRSTAETEAANVIQAARAKAEASLLEARARAQAIEVIARAEADATRIKAETDAAINDEFAQRIAQSRLEVERTKAFGDRTVFAPSEALMNGGLGAYGLATALGNRK